jgi:hypothetical protein
MKYVIIWLKSINNWRSIITQNPLTVLRNMKQMTHQHMISNLMPKSNLGYKNTEILLLSFYMYVGMAMDLLHTHFYLYQKIVV